MIKLHPRLSASAVVLARRAERFRPTAERDAAGWVIGFGHRASAREGAVVTEDDADVLLIYDLSRSAGVVGARLTAPVDAPLFDALNAYAFKLGPDGFGRSEMLMRVNAGEAVTSAEVLRARDAAPAPGGAGVAGEGGSAVLAAAAAVSERLSRVDLDPPPPPPRAPREPWPEPDVAPLSAAPEAASPAPRLDEATVAEAPVDTAPLPVATPAPEPAADPAEAGTPQPSAEAVALEPEPEPEPEPAPEPVVAEAPPPMAVPPQPAPSAETPAEPPPAPSQAPDEAASSPVPPAPLEMDGDDIDLPPPELQTAALRPTSADAPRAPIVSFERGGRPRLATRLRSDPRVYVFLAGLGVGLILWALAGLTLARPTVSALVLGLVGLLCLAPAAAFFIERRRSRRPG